MSCHTAIFFACAPSPCVSRGPHHCILVGWMNHRLSCLSQTPFLSPFLPLWTTFEPPQEFIRVLRRLASYLWLARNGGRKESSYLLFFLHLPLRQPTAYRCKHHTQCPSSCLRTPNQRGWLTAAIKWPPGETNLLLVSQWIWSVWRPNSAEKKKEKKKDK